MLQPDPVLGHLQRELLREFGGLRSSHNCYVSMVQKVLPKSERAPGRPQRQQGRTVEELLTIVPFISKLLKGGRFPGCWWSGTCGGRAPFLRPQQTHCPGSAAACAQTRDGSSCCTRPGSGPRALLLSWATKWHAYRFRDWLRLPHVLEDTGGLTERQRF